MKTYRQSVLKWAFEGRLTEEWRKQQVEQSEMLTGAERNVSKLGSAEALLKQIQEERQAHYQKQLEEWEVAVKKLGGRRKAGAKASKKPKKLKELLASRLTKKEN